MRLSPKLFFSILAAAVLARLLSMAFVPLMDTSEPRYAEIARLMAVSGDWITPWFEPGSPFWGKPPLSFWAQAASIKLFGVSEFAVRLPSFLALVAVGGLMYVAGARMLGIGAARWAILIFATMLLPAVSAGAVLTDPFLVMGVTLSMVAFILAQQHQSAVWRYGFFVGLAIGLLSKGPLSLLLVFGALIPWMLFHRNGRTQFAALPWGRGLALTLMLSLPWYLAAEWKTPGFLQYFIVGEHFLRFVDAGWTGDLYGTAHKRVLGSIWIDAVLAALPWSIYAVSGLIWLCFKPKACVHASKLLKTPIVSFLCLWALVAPVFFTLSGNILWTYVLPSLPPLALLLGTLVDRHQSESISSKAIHRLFIASTMILPAIALALGAYALFDTSRFKTEKHLVAAAHEQMEPGEALYFLGSRPFSARYYTEGKARLVGRDELAPLLLTDEKRIFLAVPKSRAPEAFQDSRWNTYPIFNSRRYSLYLLDARRHGGELRSDRSS